MDKISILWRGLFLAYLAVIFVILLFCTWVCTLPSVEASMGFVVCFIACGASEIMMAQEIQDIYNAKFNSKKQNK